MKQQETMDQAVRNWLVSEAPEAIPADLHEMAMQGVATAGQKLGWLAALDNALRGGRLDRPALGQALALAAAFVLISVVAVGILAFVSGRLVQEPANTPQVPILTPTPTPPDEATRAVLADKFFAPFEYLVPESVEMQADGYLEDFYQITTVRPGGGRLIVARIDLGRADNCPRKGLAGSVQLPTGVDQILETLATQGGMTLTKSEVGLSRSGRTAYAIDTTAECLDHIHSSGAQIALTRPLAKTWIMDVSNGTVMIQASGNDASAADERLPIADGIVRSIRFLEDSQAPVSTNSPEPSIAAIITPGVVPSFDPVVASEASDFSVPFQYLAPESLHLEGRAITSNYYLLLSREAGGGEMIVARIDGANSSDCPQRLAPGSVELPAGIEPILETLAAESGLSFERQEVTLDRSGRTAYELTTTADCESSSIEVDRELGIHGPQVELALWKTWILDIGEATILIQARPGFTAHELGGPDRSEEWLQSASQILGSMVFESEASSAPERSPSIAWTDFNRYLEGYGQLFTPTAVPSEIADWSDSVTTLTHELGNPAQLTYGVVTCVNEALNCANRGLVRPDESLAIWLLEFPPVVGCPQWATVDARTGEFINGTGPPC